MLGIGICSASQVFAKLIGCIGWNHAGKPGFGTAQILFTLLRRRPDPLQLGGSCGSARLSARLGSVAVPSANNSGSITGCGSSLGKARGAPGRVREFVSCDRLRAHIRQKRISTDRERKRRRALGERIRFDDGIRFNRALLELSDVGLYLGSEFVRLLAKLAATPSAPQSWLAAVSPSSVTASSATVSVSASRPADWPTLAGGLALH